MADGDLRAPSNEEALVCKAIASDMSAPVTWEQHEGLLRALYYGLVGQKDAGQRLDRCSPTWKVIGFQRDDPLSDFRGGGVAALRWMVWYVRTAPMAARASLSQQQTLREQSSCERGMPWACAAINVLRAVTDAFCIAGAGPPASRRCWGLVRSYERFSRLVAAAFTYIEREFVRSGARYLDFNRTLQRCTGVLSAALDSDGAGSLIELRLALDLPLSLAEQPDVA